MINIFLIFFISLHCISSEIVKYLYQPLFYKKKINFHSPQFTLQGSNSGCNVTFCKTCDSSLASCLSCLSGFTLVNNQCLSCPDGCDSCLSSLSISSFPFKCQAKEDNGILYFLNGTGNGFVRSCQNYCISCQSIVKCDVCAENAYIAVPSNSLFLNSCRRCGNPVCSTCILYNSSGEVKLSDFPGLSYIDFGNLLTNGTFFEKCTSCQSGFYLFQSNNSCVICSNLIPNCLSCNYYIVTQGPICTNCLNGNPINPISGGCDCSNSRCILCNNSGSCFQCVSGYWLDQNSCLQCPLNCEKCRNNNGSIECYYCSEGFFLQVENGTCVDGTGFSDLVARNNECSRFLRNNGNFYCQKCINPTQMPDENGMCKSCELDNCYSCYKQISNIENFNVTDLLINYPNAFFSSSIQTQLSSLSNICSSCKIGYNLTITSGSLQICAKMDKYDSCGTCGLANSLENCVACQKCDSLQNSLLQKDDYIENVDFKNPYYAKRLYQFLAENYTILQYPDINQETSAYLMTVYNELFDIQMIDFNQTEVQRCLPCHFGSLSCEMSPIYTPTIFGDSLSSESELLSYYTVSTPNYCRYGFNNISDSAGNMRCRFCPKDWSSCYAFKQYNIHFSTNNDPYFDVHSFSDLMNLFSEMSTNEFALILNEFYVEEVQISVLIDPKIRHNLSGQYRYVLSLPFLKNVQSLKKLSIEFKPSNYDDDPSTIVEMYMQNSFVLTGFTHISFRNIRFFMPNVFWIITTVGSAAPIDVFSKVAGILAEASTEASMFNCSFVSSGENSNSLFLINLKAEKIEMANISIQIFRASFQNCFTFESFFVLESDTYGGTIMIENCSVYNTTLPKFDLFHFIGSSSVQISNFKVLNSTFQSQLSFLPNWDPFLFNNLFKTSGNPNLFFLDSSIFDSVFSDTYILFPESLVPNLEIENFILRNVSFVHHGDQPQSLFSSKCINLKQIYIDSCYLTNVLVFTSDNTGSQCSGNFAIFDSIHLIKNLVYPPEMSTGLIQIVIGDTSLPSDVMIKNLSVLKNELGTGYQLSITIGSIYMFYGTNIANLTVEGFSLLNSSVICGIYIENGGSISIENVTVSNEQVLTSQPQVVIMVSSLLKNVVFSNFYLSNIYNNDQGLINIYSSVIDQKERYLNVSQIRAINNQLLAMELSTTSNFVITSDDKLIIEISDCVFSDTFVKDVSLDEISTSAISFDSLVSVLQLISSNFLNLNSIGTKNAIYIALDSFSITNCSFDNIGTTSGSALRSQGSVGYFSMMNGCSVKKSNFTNIIGYDGGVFFINNIGAKEFEISDCLFLNTTALNTGGVLYTIFTDFSTNLLLFFSNCRFFNITAKAQGGLFMITGFSSNIDFQIISSEVNSINAPYSSLIVAQNIKFLLNGTNVSINSLGRDMNSLKKFPGENNVNFLVGSSLISLQNCETMILDSHLSDLYVYSAGYCLVYISTGKFSTNNSIFENIFFAMAAFYFQEADVLLNSSIFLNCSTPYIENYEKFDIFYLPFIYHMSGQLSLTNCNSTKISCLRCRNQGNFIFSQVSLTINDSLFIENQGAQGSVIYIDISSDNSVSFQVSINNCQFRDNSVSSNGGCILIKGANTTITDSQFLNNSAGGYGGAINYQGDIDRGANLYLINSSFINNRALIGGAAYYQTLQIQVNGCVFTGNKAQYYGNSLFSYPRKLLILPSNYSNLTNNSRILNNYTKQTILTFFNGSLNVSNFRSGNTFPDLLIQLLDETDEPLSFLPNGSNPGLSLQIIGGNPISIFSINGKKELENIIMDTNGLFRISNMVLIAQPNSTVNLTFSSTSIFQIIGNQNLQSGFYELSMEVKLRECRPGELFQNISGTCSPCKTDEEYSYNISDSSCKKCLDGFSCSDPGSPTVLPGYWRDNVFSEIIIKCENNPYACIGGSSARNSLCAEGYIGAKCESCDIAKMHWNSTYSKQGQFKCLECRNNVLNYILVFFLSLINFFLMGKALKGTYNVVKTTLQIRVVKAFSQYSMLPIEEKNESSIYIKIYLSYFQIIQILMSMKLSIPNTFSSFSSSVGNPVFYISDATDCMFIQLLSPSFPYIYLKLAVVLFIPCFYFLIFGLVYYLYATYHDIKRKYQMLYSVCLFSLFYYQPSIIRYTISVLSCVTISNVKYIKMDTAFYCNTDDYNLYSAVLAIPSLILWGVLVPAVLFWKIYLHRHRLKEVKVRLKYGYLYQEYRIFFWEFVRMYEKILIIIFMEFYDSEIVFKSLLVLIAVVSYFVLLDKFKPYNIKNQNQIDKMTSTVLAISIFCGLLIWTYPADYVQVIGWMILIGINLVYNIIMLRLIFSYFSKFFVLFLNLFPFFRKFTFKKEIYNDHALQKWKNLRRLTARYLREKYRKKQVANLEKADISFFRLELADYDPKCVGIKRIKKIDEKKKMIKLEKKRSLNLNKKILDEEEMQNLSKPATIQHEREKTPMTDFLNDALTKLRFDENNDL